MLKKLSKCLVLFILVFIFSLTGCGTHITQNKSTDTISNNKALSTSKTDIKVSDISKLNIIGKTPSQVAYKMPGNNQTVAYLGTWDGSALTTKLDYSVNSPSVFGFGATPLIFNKNLIYKTDAPYNKIDINKLLIVYVKEGLYADSHEEIVAYSKVVDSQNRVNNISEIQYSIDNINKSDIIASIVAVVKDKTGYKLVSNTVNYGVTGDIPAEMISSAIDEPKGDSLTVDINKLFIAYMTFTDLSQIGKTYDSSFSYKVNLVTYSPLTGGTPVNLDNQP